MGQIAIPVAFAAIMLSLRGTIDAEDVPQTSYYDKSDWMYSFDGSLNLVDDPYLAACTASRGSAVIGLSPEGDNVISKLKNIFENNLNLQTRYFKDIDEINAFTSMTDYASSPNSTLCLAVIMNKNNVNDKYEYSLMFNTSQSQGEESVPKTSSPRIKDLDRENLDSLEQYGRNGFLALQNLIDNMILQNSTGVTTARIESDVTSRMVEAHRKDDIASALRGQSRIYLDIPLLVPYLRLITGIVSEKEKRIKEGMKIMGLQNSSFYLSWLITYFLIFTVISLLVAEVLTSGFFKLSSFGLVFLWHWEFTMCLMALAFFVSVFSNKAKQASLVGFVINLLLGMFQYIVGNNDGVSSSALIASSIAPSTSIGLSADHIFNLESAGLGLTSETAILEVMGYQMTYHYITMAVDIIVLLALAWYFDQILPSEFGIRKHPLFCLMRKKKTAGKVRISQSLDEQNNIVESSENPDNFEEAEAALKIQDEINESVVVQNLRKVYDSKKVAVDGVSFSMYNNQIFALLGHNGAGKTTTISMITGLFGSTQGTTKVFGMDNQTQIDEIRKVMGVCPQHDILFDDLTVKEHLELFAAFKGVDPQLVPQEVEKTIRDIGLEDKTDYLAKNLSGGQKRKLSIGIAFLGGSRFIILDEPSSGMDTSARRKLWDLLKNYKHNRVILLTTHFMDEADYLGDRIGIMGEGKLKCLGRPLFLKSRFGAGYNLTLVKKDINDSSKPIKELVLSHVEGGKVLSDISAEISLQLPLEAAPKFEKLFDDLDKNLEKLRISSYGISETTLEEVFLNVAKVTADKKQKEEQPTQPIQDAELDQYDPRRDCMTNKWDLFRTHFGALVMKRLRIMKRDKKSLIFEILVPIILVIVGILLNKVEFNVLGPAIPLTDNLYGYRFQVDYNTFVPPDGGPIYDNFISKFDSNAFQMTQKTVTGITEFNNVVYDDQGKDILHSPVNVFSFYTDTFDTGNHQYRYTTFINTRAQEGSAFAMNKINNAILKLATGNNQKEITVVVTPFQKTQGVKNIDKIFEGITLAFIFVMGMSFIPGSLIVYIVREREVNAKHQQIVSGVSVAAYWLSNYFVDIIKYLIPAIVNSLLALAFDATALIEGDKYGAVWTVFILYGFAIVSFVYLLSFFFKNYEKAQLASFFLNFVAGFVGATIIGILRLFESTMTVAKALQWIFRVLPTFSMAYGFLNIANREAYSAVEKMRQPMNVFDINLVLGDVLYLAGAAIIYFALVFVIEKLKNKQSLAVALSRENGVAYIPQEQDDDVQREEQEIEKSDNHTYSIKVNKLRKVYRLDRKKYKAAVEQVSFGVKNGECFGLLGVNGAGKTTTFKILSGDLVQTSGKAYINGYTIPDQMEEARKDIGYCPQFDALLEHLTGKEHLQLYAAIKGIPKHLRERLVEKHLQEMNLKQYENVPAGTYSGGNKRKLSVAIAIIGNPSIVFLDEPSTGMDPEARRAMWNVISRISRERKQSSVILTTHSMEEAEALSTKMGIMVNGNLKCLGTSQHIKSKFGGGYEIEIKLNLPSQEQVVASLRNIDYDLNQSVNRQEVESILDKLELSHLKNEITSNGSGSAIFTELKKDRTSAGFVVDWALSEATGEKLKGFLTDNFGDITLIEHFQSFFRYKAPNKFSIGKFFGVLEANKAPLNILQYSIRQSTIEQIFNNFANDKVQEPNAAQAEVKINIE